MVDFEISLSNPSAVSDKLKFELIRDKVDTFNAAITTGGMTRDWAYETIWGFQEEEAEEMKKASIEDAKLTYRLMSIAQSGEDPKGQQELQQGMEQNKFSPTEDQPQPASKNNRMAEYTKDLAPSSDDASDLGETEVDNPYGKNDRVFQLSQRTPRNLKQLHDGMDKELQSLLGIIKKDVGGHTRKKVL